MPNDAMDDTREPLPAMMTIAEFCRDHRISRAMFYKLHKQNKTPPIAKVGTRSLISADAAAQWRRGLERGRS